MGSLKNDTHTGERVDDTVTTDGEDQPAYGPYIKWYVAII
jgi:hypothetical protein